MNRIKWLYPGMRVKRWLLLSVMGILIISFGTAITLGFEFLGYIESSLIHYVYKLTGKIALSINIFAGILLIIIGLYIFSKGITKTLVSLINTILPDNEEDLVEIVFQKRQLKRGPKIVALGGGTGLSTLLRGLKEYTSNITAVVTVSDDGGSSGILREEMGILPPGDIRNCLVALADTEPLMEKLFQYRFTEGELKKHSFGNLFIAIMTEITGDFDRAVQESSKVLAVRGKVIPSTLSDITLHAEHKDGKITNGESKIGDYQKPIKKVFLKPKDAAPLPETIKAIKNADAIILGPGSLFTSVIPNLLIKDVAEAIRESNALKIYICNVMTQPGETDHYSVADHAEQIINHVGFKVFDYIVVNDEEITEDLAEKYAEEGAHSVEVDHERLKTMGIDVIQGSLISKLNLVRHNPYLLSQLIIKLIIRLDVGSERFKFLDWYSNYRKKN
ncbi:MAG: YvcK family protein [Halanaerobiales bacterium]|nr:YvcK family protein [Halanaerobiales bacterium]